MSDPGTQRSRRALLTGAFGMAIAAGLLSVPRAASARTKVDPGRVDALIARMTIREKAGQLTVLADPFRFRPQNVNPLDGQGDPARVSQMIRDGQVGSLFNGVGAEAGRRIQSIAVEQSRLGIPLLFAADIIHGLKTVFPVPLAEAAAFDPDLALRTARAAAIEGAASGIHQTYAPMVDVARDQRWGRVVEGAGEDVWLNEVLAAARVRGFQGERGLADHDALLATPKHFAAYSAGLGGMDYNSADMSDATLRGTFLPPFKAAFDAGALSVMTAFNDVNGVPATGNPYLLTEILRDEWDFTGFVVSDYTADQELIAHGFARDGRDAARIALMAGVDASIMSGLFLQHIPDLVASGEVPLERVDQAVRRVLMTKAALGLFDDPYRGCDPGRERIVVGSQAHRMLGHEAAVKSIVLLKNDGNLLPLRTTGQRIALIGPFAADVDVFGPWTIWGDESRRVSLAEGFRTAMEDAGALEVVDGSGVETALPGGLEAAVLAASRADVVILALGESSRMSGEAQSRTEIDIPPAQRALAEAVRATGKPVVVLLRNGRALDLTGPVAEAEAIVVTWFLGGEMGHAVADIVFGKVSPSGRLPVSFPMRGGQQPFSYDHRSTGRPADPTLATQEYTARYRDVANVARYPFGHGLTYAPLIYGPVTLSAAQLAWDGTVEVAVTVTNGGDRAVEETVQLYIHDRVASLTQPVRRLRDVRKVRLDGGASATARFTLDRGRLMYTGPDGRLRIEPGEFDIWLAPSAQAGQPATLTLRPG